MRYFAVALTLALALTLTGTSDARAAAWCAWYDPYTYNCGFYTFEQCQATVLGAGGYCARNVNEPPPKTGSRPPRRRSRD